MCAYTHLGLALRTSILRDLDQHICAYEHTCNIDTFTQVHPSSFLGTPVHTHMLTAAGPALEMPSPAPAATAACSMPHAWLSWARMGWRGLAGKGWASPLAAGAWQEGKQITSQCLNKQSFVQSRG